MAVDIKQAHRKLVEEAYGKGRLEAFDEVCDPAVRSHDPVAGDGDLRKAKQDCAMYRSAFSDLRCTVLLQIAEGDLVATHWRMTGTNDGALMGIGPTGAKCTVEGISFGRFRGGKQVEVWVQWDGLGLMRQLGVGTQAGARGEEARPQP